MNWLFTILFYIVYISLCLLLGNFVLQVADYKASPSKSFIAGFFTYLLSGFIVGCPCILFHVSWNFYFIIQLIAFIAISAIGIISNRKKIFTLQFYKNIFSPKAIHIFFKNNWFLVLFCAVMIYFSISNNLPYYKTAYDDAQYIGKLVNYIGASKLGLENAWDGSVLSEISIDYKMFNTFDLFYSFLSVLFQIPVIFFCRGSMNLLCYILFVVVYKEFASIFVKRKYAQYTLFLFYAIIFGQGYLNHLEILSYDFWRLQVGMFYGGSVAKINAIPCLTIFSMPLFKKLDFKKIIFIILLSVSMISLSTIYVIEFGFFAIAFWLVWSLYKSLENGFKKKWFLVCLSLLLFIVMILLIIGSTYIDKFPQLTHWPDAADDSLGDMSIYNTQTILYRYGYIILFILLLFVRNKKQLGFLLICGICYLFVRFIYLRELALLLTAYQNFGIERYVSAVQYIFALLIGIILVEICCRIRKPYILLNTFSLLFLSFISYYFYTNFDEITSYTGLGTGLCELGYDFTRPLNINTEMAPDITYELKDYFETIPYGNYRFYAGKYFTCEGKEADPHILYLASNRIESCTSYGYFYNGMTSEQDAALDAFCHSEDMSYESIQTILEDCSIDYYMVYTDNAKQQLENAGKELVLQNNINEDIYYLFCVD